MEKLLTPEEVAGILAVSINTIYTWVHQKKITPIKLSRNILRFSENDIALWIESKTQNIMTSSTTHDNAQARHRKSAIGNVHLSDIDRIVACAKEEVLGR